jgi:ATP-binding cassette, subfamily B (MDR/TAP), member 1
LGCCVFTSIAAGVALPLMFIIFGKLVNDFTAYADPNSDTTIDFFKKSVNKNALYILYIFIGKLVMSYISLFSVRVSGLRISASIRMAYLEALFRQPLSSIDALSTGKVSHRITTSSNLIQLGISQPFALLIQSISFLLGFYILAFVESALLTLVASATLPAVLLLYGISLPLIIRHAKLADNAKEQASALAHEIFSSIRIVAAFGAEKTLSAKYAKWVGKAREHDTKNAPMTGLLLSPTMFMVLATWSVQTFLCLFISLSSSCHKPAVLDRIINLGDI